MSVVNPAKAGSPALDLNPAKSGKYFSKVSKKYTLQIYNAGLLIYFCIILMYRFEMQDAHYHVMFRTDLKKT